jgi:hypothetical protein
MPSTASVAALLWRYCRGYIRDLYQFGGQAGNNTSRTAFPLLVSPTQTPLQPRQENKATACGAALPSDISALPFDLLCLIL